MGLRKRRAAGEAQAASAGPFEHYKFDGEESSMHLEWRARQGKGHLRMVRIVQECLVWLLGVGLGLLVGSMTIAARVSPAPTCLQHTYPPRPRDTHRSALICPRLPSRALTSYVSLTPPLPFTFNFTCPQALHNLVMFATDLALHPSGTEGVP